MPITQVPLAHEQIKRRLLRRIGTDWKAGAQLPSVMDLAREMGSGQRNTQRALAELAAEGVIVSRRGKGTMVAEGFEHALRRRKAEGLLAGLQLGVVVADVADAPFLPLMLDLISEQLIGADASVRRITLAWGASENRADPRVQSCQGLVLLNPSSSKPIQLLPGVPTVIVSTTGELTVRAAEGYDFVGVDDRQGGFLAGNALKNADSQRPCFIGVSDSRDPGAYADISLARLRGFRTGLGFDLRPEHCLRASSYSVAAGARVASAFLKLNPRPDGVFAASDELAVGFAMGAIAANAEPGRDYRLIGFDGHHALRPIPDCPPIASVLPPVREMAHRAAELLAQRIIQPERPAQRMLFSCTIFEGATI